MSRSLVPMKPPVSRGMHQLRLFFIALQFYTRLPIPRWVGFDPAWLAQASRYLPAVGLVVGSVAALTYGVALWLWSHPVAVLLSMVASIYLTGAFHEDGFADTCDGFGGGTTRERILEIMKDSRVGSYGAIGIALLLALKAAALISMPVQAVPIALVVAHPLSRLGALALVWRLEYVTANGKAKEFARHLGTEDLGIAAGTSAIVVVLALLTDSFSVGALLLGVAAVAGSGIWIGHVCRRRIGGYTGDCLGATQQVGEIAFYLAMLAVIG